MSKKQAVAVTKAAQSAGTSMTRFSAVEAEATRIHQEQAGATLMRALLKDGKLHAVVSDGKSTIEVMDGAVALSVAQPE